jgi:hypothetical protein
MHDIDGDGHRKDGTQDRARGAFRAFGLAVCALDLSEEEIKKEGAFRKRNYEAR